MKDNDIEIDLVENCIASSYQAGMFSEDLYEYRENILLEDDYELLRNLELRNHPALYLNKQLFEEQINPINVVNSVCSMLADKSGFCADFLEAQLDEKTNKHKKKSIIFIVIMVILIVAFNIGIYFLCKKYLANKISEKINSGTIDMDGKINNAVSKYFQLQENV